MLVSKRLEASIEGPLVHRELCERMMNAQNYSVVHICFMLPWGNTHSGCKCQNSVGYIAAEEKNEHEPGLLPSRYECMVDLYD